MKPLELSPTLLTHLSALLSYKSSCPLPGMCLSSEWGKCHTLQPGSHVPSCEDLANSSEEGVPQCSVVSQNLIHTMSPKGTLKLGEERKKSSQVQKSKYQLKYNCLRLVDELLFMDLTWYPGVQHIFGGNAKNWFSDLELSFGLRGLSVVLTVIL